MASGGRRGAGKRGARYLFLACLCASAVDLVVVDFLVGPLAQKGLVFSTQVVGPDEAELALVMLGFGDLPARRIQEIVGKTPGLERSE